MKEVILLAGGFGTRLASSAPNIPKALAPVDGKPFLDHLLDELRTDGFDHVILAVGHLAEQVISHYSKGFTGLEISFSIEENPLGTGGAAKKALSKLRGDHVYVANGDTYLQPSTLTLERKFPDSQQTVALGMRVSDTFNFSRFELAGERVIESRGRGVAGPGWAASGWYRFGRSTLESHPSETFSLEDDFLPTILRKGPISFFEVTSQLIDIGTPDSYERFALLVKKKFL